MSARNGTTYTYNGDGVLLFDGTTRYTQDLAAPLSQILQTTQGGATINYVYGLDRLAAIAGGTQTWYVGDALGSMRQTLSDVGAPLGNVHYDPWGAVESGSVPMFGFTGELQDTASGLVNLRARWYSTEQGRFTSHRWRSDESFDEIPSSHHPYAYSLSNPVNWTDPTGKCVPWIDPTCRPFWEDLKENEVVVSTGWEDFQQYSAGVVEGMGAPGAAIASLAKAETWQAVGRGLDSLVNDPSGSAAYLQEQLVDPVARGAQLVARDPRRAAQILNENPRGVGQVFGGAASSAAGARSYLRARAARAAAANKLVTRWRGTDFPDDIATLERGLLESKAQRAGIPPTFWNRSFVARFWHSLTSDNPPSQFVSLTRNPRVAQQFARCVFEFEVRQGDLYRAWWNLFGEAEDLAPGGTPIQNVRRLP
jgi:RHS repeat-associated protein